MKIVCINNYIYKNLTLGKIYDVINYGKDWCLIINDNDEKNCFLKKCFKPLSEYRIEMINKLLKDESKMF